jgi:hypothetical protein
MILMQSSCVAVWPGYTCGVKHFTQTLLEQKLFIVMLISISEVLTPGSQYVVINVSCMFIYPPSSELK